MSMNKVIHAAIRRDLDRFVGALARSDPVTPTVRTSWAGPGTTSTTS